MTLGEYLNLTLAEFAEKVTVGQFILNLAIGYTISSFLSGVGKGIYRSLREDRREPDEVQG